MKAWHFTSGSLRNGRPLPKVGEKLVHDGEVVMCKSGLHASKRIIDALEYAPGDMIHRVECGGEIIHGNDKLVCSERTILFTVDGKELLRKFARMCALDVIDQWDAPEAVIRWLKTGDESIREAARSAAYSASISAAYSAAFSAHSADWGGSAYWAYWASISASFSAASLSLRPSARSAERERQSRRLHRMVMRANKTTTNTTTRY